MPVTKRQSGKQPAKAPKSPSARKPPVPPAKKTAASAAKPPAPKLKAGKSEPKAAPRPSGKAAAKPAAKPQAAAGRTAGAPVAKAAGQGRRPKICPSKPVPQRRGTKPGAGVRGRRPPRRGVRSTWTLRSPAPQVALLATDLDRSIAFYRDILGLRLHGRYDPPDWRSSILAAARAVLSATSSRRRSTSASTTSDLAVNALRPRRVLPPPPDDDPPRRPRPARQEGRRGMDGVLRASDNVLAIGAALLKTGPVHFPSRSSGSTCSTSK